ncbi:MAG: OmpP1/FadL family transporter [Neisseriaceae bacterium]|nr:OmpP1/FadL family transporter [Neisseriaceae bacterium]
MKRIVLSILALTSGGIINASGFILDVQSADSMSTATANKAEAADPSTIYYNPSGLTYLDGFQISSSLFIMDMHIKYYNAEAQYFATHVPVSGRQGGKISSTTPVPQTFLSYKINDTATFGLGIYAPFGAETDYSKDSVLRYNVNQTKLQSIAFNPTFAFRITPNQSIGIGLIAQYTEAKLRQFADFSPAMNEGIPIIGKYLNLVKDGAGDGYAKLKGDDWGFGYSLGWLWDINDSFRVGFTYRSKIVHTLKGKGEWHLDGTAFTWPLLGKRFYDGVRDAGYVVDEDGKVDITLPEIVSIHGAWKINPQLNLFGDASYSRHSRFTDITIQWKEPKMIADAVNVGEKTTGNETHLKPSFKSGWKFALGGTYQVTEPLQLRAGISYDKSAVRSPEYRISTIPDNDRYGLGLGGKYKINDKTDLSISYTYFKVKNASAHVNGWCGVHTESGPGAKSCVSSRSSGNADFKSYANVLGVQLTRKF